MKTNSQTDNKKTVSRVLNVFLIMITLAPQISWAEVNTREGNFTYTWYDRQQYETPPNGPPLGLEVDRTYNSRSHHRGIFGFRWCSSLDKILDKIPEASPSENCEPEPPPRPQPELIKRLSATEYQVLLPHRNVLLVTLDSALLLVTQIQFENGLKIKYGYAHDNLILVEKSDRTTITYAYDLSHNLLEIKDGSSLLHLDYELLFDRVTDFNYGDGCADHFSYLQKPSTSPRSHVELTTVTRTCQGKTKFSNTYEFTQRQSPGETAFHLIKFRIFNPIGVQTEVSYE
jgi:Domain of unknown function (DUF6531)